MAVGALFTLPWVSPLDSGTVVPLSKLTFSLTGTATAANTYSDSGLTVANANPLQADAAGIFGLIYLDPSIVYRVKWTTVAGVQLKQSDDIVAGQTVSTSYRIKDTAPTLYLVETDASANNGHWRIRVDGEQLSIDVGNDAESSWVQALTIDRTLNVVDTINLKAAANQSNGVALATLTSGSFVGAWSGFSVAPTGTIYYYKIGSLIYLWFSTSNTGTSNSTGMTITNIPSAIRPNTSTNPEGLPFWLVDNSAQALGGCYFSNSGQTLNFMKGSAPPSDTGFTNVNSKGMNLGSMIVYSL